MEKEDAVSPKECDGNRRRKAIKAGSKMLPAVKLSQGFMENLSQK
jgi:hypothetical protein